MIGDIIEMARAKAALGDVAQFRAGGIGPKSEHENIPAGEGGGAADVRRWGWESLARMAARLLPVST